MAPKHVSLQILCTMSDINMRIVASHMLSMECSHDRKLRYLKTTVSFVRIDFAVALQGESRMKNQHPQPLAYILGGGEECCVVTQPLYLCTNTAECAEQRCRMLYYSQRSWPKGCIGVALMSYRPIMFTYEQIHILLHIQVMYIFFFKCASCTTEGRTRAHVSLWLSTRRKNHFRLNKLGCNSWENRNLLLNKHTI